jgi:hypothetical protein
MRDRKSTHPFAFFFLVLPYGISSGFVSITLPFVLTRVGFSVALAASIVAIGVSANLWRFFWGPVADLTFTAPLVFVGPWHVRRDVVGPCASSPPSRRRRHFDDSCFHFASCGNIDCASGRWVDGTYGR